jgi:AcrR family transcriptional regulator
MKQSYHHGNLKESLVQAALQIVEKEGWHAITLRELSAQLGTSRSAIYRHFDSKESLMQAVIFAGFELLENTIAPIVHLHNKSVAERLNLMGHAYLEFALQHPNIYRMLFGHELQNEREEQCDMNDETQATGFYALVGLLIEGQESGFFKKNDPLLQAITIWSMVHGIANLLIDGHVHIQDNIEAIYTMGMQTLLEGLSAK